MRIGFSPKECRIPDYEAFATLKENTGDSRDEELGSGSYGDRRAVRVERGWPRGGKVPEAWRFADPRQVRRHGDDGQCALGRCLWSKWHPQELFDGPQEGWQMVDRKG